jgi:hypothetical protein
MKVGDVVYRQRDNGKFDELTISKVGRKWVETNKRGVRFNTDTLYVDKRFGAAVRVWLSLDDYKRELVLNATWARFRGDIGRTYRAPDGMTLERIAEARRVLGMEERE